MPKKTRKIYKPKLPKLKKISKLTQQIKRIQKSKGDLSGTTAASKRQFTIRTARGIKRKVSYNFLVKQKARFQEFNRVEKLLRPIRVISGQAALKKVEGLADKFGRINFKGIRGNIKIGKGRNLLSINAKKLLSAVRHYEGDTTVSQLFGEGNVYINLNRVIKEISNFVKQRKKYRKFDVVKCLKPSAFNRLFQKYAIARATKKSNDNFVTINGQEYHYAQVQKDIDLLSQIPQRFVLDGQFDHTAYKAWYERKFKKETSLTFRQEVIALAKNDDYDFNRPNCEFNNVEEVEATAEREDIKEIESDEELFNEKI